MKLLKLNDKKKAQSLLTWAIHRPHPPATLRVPISAGKNNRQKPCVRLGEQVAAGSKIAEPENEESVPAFSAIEGRVSSIGASKNIFGGEIFSVEVTGDPLAQPKPIYQEDSEWESLTRQKMLERLQANGALVHNPTLEAAHARIARQKEFYEKTLVVNGCESEPYVTSDHALMMSHAVEILKATNFLKQAMNAEKVIIAVEKNKLEVIELLKSKIYRLGWRDYKVVSLPAAYPQGDPVVLMRTLFPELQKITPGDILAMQNLWNPSTLYGVYEAGFLNKPLFERAVTITGECVVEPKNVWIPIGASLEYALKTCRGLLREPAKLLVGGPMKGWPQPDRSAPTLAAMEALVAIAPEVIHGSVSDPCIRCGECLDVCPADISPALISVLSEAGEMGWAAELESGKCLECGNCGYVCPSKRPMVELLRMAGAGAWR